MSIDHVFERPKADSTNAAIAIRRPDDWHVHLRDGAMLKAVLPFTAAQFARGIIMPNLVPPVTTVAAAAAYRDRILAARPPGSDFQPLMTCYLTDTHRPTKSRRATRKEFGLRPSSTRPARPPMPTTASPPSSASRRVLERMEKIGMPVLIHGEATDPAIDIFDREAVFMEQTCCRCSSGMPGLKVVSNTSPRRKPPTSSARMRPASPAPSRRTISSSTVHRSFKAACVRISTACRSPSANGIARRCASAATSGDELLLHRNRHRAAPEDAEGSGLRLRRHLRRRVGPADLCPGLRRGKCARSL